MTFISTFVLSKANQADQRLLEVRLQEDPDYPVQIRDVHIVRAPYQTRLPHRIQIPIGQTSSDPPFAATISYPAPDLQRLFFGYFQEEDIDFNLIRSISLDPSPIDLPHPIRIAPPHPTPSIPSAAATFNTEESNHAGENQSSMTETGVIHPFILSPPRSLDQSN